MLRLAALGCALAALSARADEPRLPGVQPRMQAGDGAENDPNAPHPASAPSEPVADLSQLPSHKPLLVLRGNQLFNQYVYRALIDLPAEARADDDTARRIRSKVVGFLRRAGYSLATVKAQAQDGQLLLDLDEGQLDKVVILGAGGWDAVRFHLDLDLPFDIYNRPLLDEKLASLCPRYGLLRCTATLIDVDPQPESAFGQQAVERLEEVPGASAFLPKELARSARAHELHIVLEQPPQHSGFWPGVDVSGPDGLLVGVNGYLGDLPLPGGWTDLKLRAGTNLRGHLDGSGSNLVLTRAVGEARVRLPALFDGKLRPAVGLLADLTSRQRGDLGVDSVMQARFEAALVGDWTPSGRSLELGLGVGLRRNVIFGLKTLSPVDLIVDATPDDLFFPFLIGFLSSDFSPEELRWDRHHKLGMLLRLRTASARSTPGAGGNGELAGDLRYQKYYGLGWHEAWLRIHGTLHLGDVLYTDEDSLSGELRGGLGDIFVRKAGSVLTEFRFSLVRDLLKVSVFDSLAAFGRVLDRTTVDERPRGALAVGVGLHALWLTVLTVDLYGSLAWTTDGQFGPAVSLEIHEAFH